MTDSIRPAQPSDAALLTELGARTFRETYAAHNTPEDMADYLARNFSVERLRSELEEPGSRFFLAFAGEDPAGYAKVRHHKIPPQLAGRRPLEIERIYVLHAHHGQGLGFRLMQACLESALESGCDVLWLGVWTKNPRAIAFYERVGFRIIGEQIFRLGKDAQKDYLMSMDLKEK